MDRDHSLIAIALCGVVAACNAVYDLKETRGPQGEEADTDMDGVTDDRDNCALVGNADQADVDTDAIGDACDPCEGPQTGQDRDGDGIDDACDVCPDGRNHEEDADGVVDGCDLCPGVADGGEDADGDGVGDACDARPGEQNTRVWFDGFGPPHEAWESWFEPWAPIDDDYGPVMFGRDGVWNRAGTVEGIGWWVEAEMETPPPTIGSWLGIKVLDEGGEAAALCYIVAYDDGYHPNDSTDVTIEVPAVTRFRVRYLGDSRHECMINGQLVQSDDALIVDTTRFVPGLMGGDRGRIHWVDVVAGP